MSPLRISQLAEQARVPATTLRYYEQVGLLPAVRTAAGYRVYDEHAVERLRFIKAAKHLQLSLNAIRELLAAWEGESCRSVKARLRPLVVARLSETEQGIADLVTLAEGLRAGLRSLDRLPDSAHRCDPSCAFLAESEPEPEPPPVSACTLGSADHQQRMREWQKLLAHGTAGQTARGMAASLPVALATELSRLIVAEQQCCPFLGFTVTFAGDQLELNVTADDPATPRALLAGAAA